MEEICGGTQPYLSEGHLEAEHLRIRDKAIFQVSITYYYLRHILEMCFFLLNQMSNRCFLFCSLSLISVYIKTKIGWRRILSTIFGSIGKGSGGAVHQF